VHASPDHPYIPQLFTHSATPLLLLHVFILFLYVMLLLHFYWCCWTILDICKMCIIVCTCSVLYVICLIHQYFIYILRLHGYSKPCNHIQVSSLSVSQNPNLMLCIPCALLQSTTQPQSNVTVMIMFYFRHMICIIVIIKQCRSKRKMMSHNVLQNRYLHTTTLIGAKHLTAPQL